MIATKSERFVAFMIDYFIIIALEIILAMSMPYINFGFSNYVKDVIALNILKMFPLFSILLKDLLFTNKSFGKKILKIEVVDADTGKNPKKWKLILRNFFLVFAVPIEIILFFAGSRRLGDAICNTIVIRKTTNDFEKWRQSKNS